MNSKVSKIHFNFKSKKYSTFNTSYDKFSKSELHIAPRR